MNTWFTSDCHFGHANVIKYCNRPYASVEAMDEGMIANWNNRVAKRDYIYILGDVFFCQAVRALEIIKQLNGHKILIYGNHDKVIRNNKPLRDHFAETHELLERKFVLGDNKLNIVMCHYAMKVWNKRHHGTYHLFGHSHGSMPDDGSRSMDVGVDACGMAPISLEEIHMKLKDRPFWFIDHHKE